jgi:hypothetical protein
VDTDREAHVSRAHTCLASTYSKSGLQKHPTAPRNCHTTSTVHLDWLPRPLAGAPWRGIVLQRTCHQAASPSLHRTCNQARTATQGSERWATVRCTARIHIQQCVLASIPIQRQMHRLRWLKLAPPPSPRIRQPNRCGLKHEAADRPTPLPPRNHSTLRYTR